MDNVELHPILETNSIPQQHLWYVVSPDGKCPELRVGHTLSYIPSSNLNKNNDTHQSEGVIVLIGGANPDVTFAETFLLDLNSMIWNKVNSPIDVGRYEHCASVAADKIFIFGGSSKSGSLNDVQCFDCSGKNWEACDVKGKSPSSRTQHSTCCSIDGDLFVYGGGQHLSDPVSDRQVYVYVPTSSQWVTIATTGVSPKPRHGHLMLFHKTEKSEFLFVHGGMSGTTFYDDLHQLKLSDCGEKRSGEWTEVNYAGSRAQRQKCVPCPRAAHGGVIFDNSIYIICGLSKHGALNDMHKLDLTNYQWSSITYNGPGPSNRLDFGYCLMTLLLPPPSSSSTSSQPVHGDVNSILHPHSSQESSEPESRIVVLDGDDPNVENDVTSGLSMEELCSVSKAQQGDSIRLKVPIHFLVIHGGMDSEGHVFDDMLAFPLTSTS